MPSLKACTVFIAKKYLQGHELPCCLVYSLSFPFLSWFLLTLGRRRTEKHDWLVLMLRVQRLVQHCQLAVASLLGWCMP